MATGIAALRALSVGAAFLAAPAVWAEPPTINDQVRQLVLDRADDGETLVGSVKLDELGEDDSATITFRISPNKTYLVYGACDEDCTDLDLVGYDKRGQEIDNDTDSDAEPLLMVDGSEVGGELKVEVTMSGCEADTCVFAIGLFELKG